MIAIVTVISIVSTALLLNMIRKFHNRYQIGIYYIDKIQEQIEMQNQENAPFDINLLRPEDYSHAMDLRGTPTHLCPCGCNIWNVKVMFEDNEIATYFLDMECAHCGSVATAPTPVDKGYIN